jgi:RsiW-degrading membrane proteinase PrsW (M82 family)
MNGILILLLLIFIAVFPAIVIFFWLKNRKFQITLPWFLVSFTAGILSFVAAAMIQALFVSYNKEGFWPLLFNVFVRIALIEEASRVITLIPLKKTPHQPKTGAIFALIGLIGGLGFAAIEGAYHGLANINITLLRTFTAVPLHAACGIREGAAVFIAPEQPVRAFFLFISSVIIHGTYNLMIVSPAIPSFLAIPTAIIALFASIHHLSDTNPEQL